MQIRPDRGWIKAGLAVLVAGSLGGGVVAATGVGSRSPKKVTAEGVTGRAALPAAAADKPLDLAAPAVPEEAPKPDPVVGDKVKVGSDGGSVTVSAVEDSVSAGRLFGAGEGRKYIAVEVKGCSGPNEKNLTFEPAYFLLRLDDGTVHDPGPGAKKPSLEGGKMPSGKCLSGWVTFTVKEGSLASAVIYDGSSRLTWTVALPKGAKPTTTTTLKPGATTTTTTAKSTPTTARSTATTGKTAAGSGKASSTTTTAKSSGSTTTTSKSGSTTTTSGSKADTTSTSGPAKSSTTTTTARTVVTTPTDQDE